jgi:hypothetical protein
MKTGVAPLVERDPHDLAETRRAEQERPAVVELHSLGHAEALPEPNSGIR